jgi:hypothetical protein
MKNLLLTTISIGLSLILNAQISASDYLKKAPAIPSKDCYISGEKQDAFEKSVQDLASVVNDDAQQRKNDTEEYMRGNEDQMKANMMKKSGMSDADMKKMQSGEEMSDAETQAMANKMMQQQANISLDEAKSLSNMSEAEQEAWAQSKTAGQMADAQANPGKYTGANETNMTLYELASEQSALQKKIADTENQIKQQYKALDKDAKSAKSAMEVELKPLYDELNSINDGEGSTQADVDHAARVIRKIHEKQDAYCEIFTPRMLGFIQTCKDTYAGALPDYDRVEEIQFQLTALQTGTPLITTGKGMYSLLAVHQYLRYLADAYNYKLYRAE